MTNHGYDIIKISERDYEEGLIDIIYIYIYIYRQIHSEPIPYYYLV